MSKRENIGTYTLPEVQKSPLNPYKYRCVLMKNKIRLMLVTISDIPESFEGEKVDEKGELELITNFNKKFCSDPANREPHRLRTGTDIFRENVKNEESRNNQCNQKDKRKGKKEKANHEQLLEDTEFVGAMALVVGVGDVSDPDKLYGMAHLTEHSVFLGSPKFPKADEIFEFIRTADGVANASTSFFFTDYFISAKTKEVYVEAIERVADMIISPLLDSKKVMNEVNAVDCEFAMRQRRASIGLLQILRSFTHKDNPMHRLSCGNRDTLKDPKLGEKLRAWKKRYYVGNLITLTFVSTMSLDELEKLAVQYFSGIDEGEEILKSVPWSIVQGSDSCGPHFLNLFKVYTEKNVRDLLINFSLSPNIWKRIGVRPFRFISSLILDRGPNGLRYFLNRNGYSVDLYAGPLERDMCLTEFNSLFSVLVVLSTKGLQNFEVVVEAVFAYFRLLQKSRPPSWFYEEMQVFNQQKFHYAYQTNNVFSRRAMARAVKNSHAMQGIRPWRILSSATLMAHFDEELISKTIDFLVPKNANIIISSQCYKSIVDTTEPYYKYKYRQEKIPGELMTRMSRSDLQFNFPLPNPHLNLTIGRICKGTNKYVRPAKITEVGAKATILCAQADEPQYGFLAKTKSAIFIKSEVIDRWEPTQLQLILELMAYHLELEINLKHKPASGSLVKINTGTRGGNLAIFIRCPSQFYVSLFDDVFNIFRQFEKNFIEDCFEAKKDRIVDTLKDKWMDDLPYGESITNYVFNGEFESYPLLKHRLAELKWSTFVKKVEEFRVRFFLTVALEGCIEDCEVDDLVRVISGWPNEAPVLGTIPMYACVSRRAVMIEKGERAFRIQSKISISEVSLIKNHYQFDQTIDEDTIRLLTSLMSLAAFYDLRSIQHLGYYVKALSQTIGGVPILTMEILTRAYIFTVGYVNERIKVFIREFYEKNIQTQAGFSEMIKNKIPEIRNLDWKTIKAIYEQYLLPTGTNYRNFSLQICGPGARHSSKPKDTSKLEHKQGSETVTYYSAALGNMLLVTGKSKKKDLENYFIFHLDKYRNSLPRFPVYANCEEEKASPFENAEGETSEEE